jgi:hypothetical protein
MMRHMKYLSADLLPKVFHGLTWIMYLSYTSNINLEPNLTVFLSPVITVQ